ncbi:amidohydrolase [Bacillus massiliigorillae]|uniref:amidohydrolase n=1 Tax=Bacillus massiliigorillae TaxID=1243664 RepID=UPI00039ECCB5|nr:amidohydrolase [Bacillus massiliigorillae]
MKTIKKADIILSSNAVFTGLANQPEPASIAIIDNKIVAIGTNEEITSTYIGTNTQVYSFEDQLIMPGFHDFHLHIIDGSLQMDCVSLANANSEQEAAEMVRKYAEARPEEPWIIGFSWNNESWVNKQLPTVASLDYVLPNKPVILMHVDCHFAWVNSKALELMGINCETENPTFGTIDKNENGELTGILYEKAMDLVFKGAFDFSRARKEQMVKNFLQMAAELGVTSLNDMYAPSSEILSDFELFKELEEAGELTARIYLAPALNGDLERAKQLRDTYSSEILQFSGLKQFVDGVISGHTAFMLEPYSDKPDSRGGTTFSPELIKKWVLEADRERFRIRLHAIGDAAVRLALDAFEDAQKINGYRDSRHTIEHIESIHPDDICRFEQLDVIASMQPQHLASIEKEMYQLRLGTQRDKFTFAVNKLKNAGAKLAFGSDFPVVSLNPLLEIYRAVTRVDSTGLAANTWNIDERITLAEALKAYTAGSAYGSFRENELGTLEVGKFADVVVLDRNLFSIPKEELLDTKVKLTIMNGRIVFEKASENKKLLDCK